MKFECDTIEFYKLNIMYSNANIYCISLNKIQSSKAKKSNIECKDEKQKFDENVCFVEKKS